MVRLAASLVALALVSQACSRNQSEQMPETTPEASGGTTMQSGGPSVPETDAAQVALGEKIFHGQVAGGTCAGCHGAKGKGTGVAPNLTDTEWLNTDGTMDGITNIIVTGVQAPKKSSGPMPPKGGAKLTDEQVRAVASYVYSLSHPEAK